MMELLLPIGLFVISTIVLVFSADRFIEAIEDIGAALQLPHFFTGVLFVAIGTSLPELMTSVAAAAKGEGDFIAGNVFGSDIANILLGLGAVVFLARKDIQYKQDIFAVHFPLLTISLVLAGGMMMDGVITSIEGLFLLAICGVYLWYLHSQKDAGEIDMPEKPFEWKSVLFAVLSLLGVLAASEFLVRAVLDMAQQVGFSSTALSATLIAIGTSLPEMMVVYSAIKKGNSEMAVGNILGSNIFNIVLILGVGAVITPLMISDLTWTILFPFTIASVVVYWTVSKNREITRHEGLAMTFLYLFFLGTLYGWI